MGKTWSPITLLCCTICAVPAAGQDQFASAVGISGSNVLVLKPGAGQGPATLFSYARDASGNWVVEARLRPASGPNSGESFSPSFAVAANEVLIAGGDPDVAWAAHSFQRSNNSWVPGPLIPVSPQQATSPGASQLDLAGLMRILQPARRVVATDGNTLAVGVIGGTAATNGVRIARRGTSGSWPAGLRVQADDVSPGDQFGAALALRGDRLAVGAPGYGDHGAVWIFRRSQGESWTQEAIIVPDSSTSTAAFGSALTFRGDDLAVGAPGSREIAGSVVIVARSVDGGWVRRAVLSPEDSRPGDRFGAVVMNYDDELWIGAPGLEGGRVHLVVGDGNAWTFRQQLAGDAPGSGFGASLSASETMLVVGAPGANGGKGGAAIFERSGPSFVSSGWVSIGGNMEAVTGAEVRCEGGEAGEFECGNVDLLAFLPVAALGGDERESVSDVWGWTDPETGSEYALVGRGGGIAIVDITRPTTPTYLGVVPGNRSGARDIKVYADHLFFTGDGAGAHGLLVFDLTRVRNVSATPVTFEPDARYDGIASAHNLVIDTNAGFAYPVGASGGGETCGGGLHMVDIRDPKNPTFAGCYTDTEGLIWAGRTHDAQCVVYAGPDERYRDRQICFASNETALRIVDVTEKDAPQPISAATYPGLSYVHQGWLTDDQRYFYLDDELDELIGQANRTRTIIWDIAELDDPVLVGEYLGPDGATDHNLYVTGDRMYQANYQAGMRVIDISDPENPVEIGFFDTTPYEGNPPGFNGAWTAYPFFSSGTVVVTSMSEGLFVVRPQPPELIPDR